MFTIFRKIKNIIPTYHQHGLDGMFYSILRNLRFKCRYHNFIDKRLHILTKEIEKISSNIVMWGPYKGMKLLNSSNANHWFIDTPNRLIGLYEYEVQKKLIELTENKKFEYLVNFGAADGYHLISIVKKGFVKKGLAFEMNPDGRKFLQKTAEVNSVSDKIEIHEKADLKYIRNNFSVDMLAKTLFLIDIETDEFDGISKFPGVFIRAPQIQNTFGKCIAIAHLEDEIVGVKQGKHMALTFHPELTESNLLHEKWISGIR